MPKLSQLMLCYILLHDGRFVTNSSWSKYSSYMINYLYCTCVMCIMLCGDKFRTWEKRKSKYSTKQPTWSFFLFLCLGVLTGDPIRSRSSSRSHIPNAQPPSKVRHHYDKKRWWKFPLWSFGTYSGIVLSIIVIDHIINLRLKSQENYDR